MVNANWPTLSVGVAFTPGTYTELVGTPGRPTSFDSKRGRQYELDRVQAGTGSVLLDNTDGRYSPGNGSSPYAGQVLPYRQCRIQATWAGTTYPVMTGYVERWPLSFTDAGAFGWTTPTTVDAFALLASTTLKSSADHEVLADSPTYLYPLDEADPAKAGGDRVNPGVNPLLTPLSAKAGPGTLTFGAATTLADAPTAVSFTPPTAGGPALTALAMPSGRAVTVPPTGPWSIELWAYVIAGSPNNQTLLTERSLTDGMVALNVLSSGALQLLLYRDGTDFDSVTATMPLGAWTHVVATLSADSLTLALYVNGALSGSLTRSAPIAYGTLVDLIVGGDISFRTSQGTQALNGSLARFATYPAVLTAARILAHYQSGTSNFAGESTDARVTRLLGYAGWPTAFQDITAGSSTVGSAYGLAGTSALEAAQSVAESEGGVLFVSAAGKVTFRGRTDRQLKTSPTWTFGEHTGELPYEDGAEFDLDPSLIYNDVTVSRKYGATFHVTDPTSSAPPTSGGYGVRSLSRELNIQSDAEAQDAANYLLGNYKDPSLRVPSLTIVPSSNTALWPCALGAEIGQRVRVNRRPLGAPATVLDCFIEAISHNVQAGRWETTFQLSRAPLPVLILDDPVYGKLDSGNVLAY